MNVDTTSRVSGSHTALPADEGQMSRFDDEGLCRFSARDAVTAVLVAIVMLVLFSGASVRRTGQQLVPGVGRATVLTVGDVTGWVADQLPLAAFAHSATGWLSADTFASPDGRYTYIPFNPPNTTSGDGAVTADAFRHPVGAALPLFSSENVLQGAGPPARLLRTLLVTGDSMSQGLAQDLAQRLDPRGIDVVRDPHDGTGISDSMVLDWAKRGLTR